MKTVLTIVSMLMMLMGVTWVLQGIDLLPGSFMTGQTKWAVIGAILAAAGLGLLAFARRRRP